MDGECGGKNENAWKTAAVRLKRTEWRGKITGQDENRCFGRATSASPTLPSLLFQALLFSTFPGLGRYIVEKVENEKAGKNENAWKG